MKTGASSGRISIFGVALLLLIMLSGAALEALAETPRGKVTGGIISTQPDWFKESFLDIAEDANEASEEGKHVMLFMDLNGCPYCYKMLEENIKHAPYTDFIKQHFDVIQLNIKGDREIAFDEETSVSEKALAKLLKVRYTPTVIFLNGDNKTVLRLNGYRSVPAFEHALRFVQEKAYLKTNLSRYIEQQSVDSHYSFRDHPLFRDVSDLTAIEGDHLALLFEDRSCDACDQLHDGHLRNPEVLSVLEKYTVVRLDANADTPLVDPQGNATTPRAYVEKLGLTYRPGLVLFDRGKEISRIDGMLYTYHFQETLRYVADRYYVQYPKSFYEYLDVRTEQLLAAGKSIDLSR